VVRRGWVLLSVVFGFMLFCAAAIMLAYKKLYKHRYRMYALAEDLASKFKITAAFFAIVLLVGGAYDVVFPLAYLDFLGFFSLFEFDFLRIFKVNVGEVNVRQHRGEGLCCMSRM
jgi:hypothetical protein